ncbi:MAG: hypothetical protein ACREHF_00705 [Rhizomicrobium sp.]
MKKRLAALALLAASVALPGMVSAATNPNLPSLKPGTFAPRYVALHHEQSLTGKVPTSELTQWNGSYTDLTGKTINFTQIGGNPATTDSTTTITVLLIPVKFVFTQGGKNYTFDPARVKLTNNHNRSVVTAIQKSPLFESNVNFNPQYGTCKGSCVDLGTTQYEDAFQRGTWWGNDVGANTNYHVVYTTVKEKEQTITFSCSNCVINNPFGSGIVGTYDINSFDNQLQTFLSKIKDVNPGVLPLFISYDVYLTSGGCCIGGYHSANGGQPTGQTYSYATYVDSTGAFSQDVSAFSHELGEWMDDPFTDNRVNCQDNSIMEVGDPLEGGANYGAYPYKDKRFTYNLQSLVYMGYFGAPTSDSANQWLALQDDMSHVCPGQ